MLFGHQNDDAQKPDGQDTPLPPPPAPGVNPLATDPDTGASLPAVATPDASQPDTDEPAVLNQPADDAADDAVTVTPGAPASSLDEPTPDTPVSTSGRPADTASGDLLDLKQQALSQLSPLVSHLDQTPEEKFRTTMMLIQSTDNQSLLKSAYDAAQAIPDEKVRAQALLDVVNEINYFTQAKPTN